MSIDVLRGLLRDLGAELGLPELAPDDQGYCSLKIGERITISIQYEPEEQDLVLFTVLGEVGEELRPEAYPILLAGNLFWAETRGGTLAVEPGTGAVFLLMKDKIQAVDGTRFRAMLTDFVETGEIWQKRLEDLAAAEEMPEPEPEPIAAPEYMQRV
jgi:Tir chaperone protein (CesT) family